MTASTAPASAPARVGVLPVRNLGAALLRIACAASVLVLPVLGVAF